MIAVLALLACGPAADERLPEQASPPGEDTVVTPVEGAPGPAPLRTWSVEVEQVRKRLDVMEKRAAAAPNAWNAWLDVVAVRQTLGRLEGGFAHHDAAWAAWRKAEAIQAQEPRVRSAHASLLQAEHRFRDALVALEGLQGREERAARASIRFELGEYATAVAELESILAEEADPSSAARLAGMLHRLGRFEDAERWMRTAMDGYHGRDRWIAGWHHLMLGIMDLDRERHDDALAHYRDAEAAFPGWWLVQEHIAEIHLIQGRPGEALPIYEEVVARTGSPELLGALADTLEALGRADEAARRRAEALKGFDDQLASHPTAAGGHAIEFLMEHGDPQRTLALARTNAELRPNGEARLLLADALERTGDGAGADALRNEVAASGWYLGP